MEQKNRIIQKCFGREYWLHNVDMFIARRDALWRYCRFGSEQTLITIAKCIRPIVCLHNAVINTPPFEEWKSFSTGFGKSFLNEGWKIWKKVQ